MSVPPPTEKVWAPRRGNQAQGAGQDASGVASARTAIRLAGWPPAPPDPSSTCRPEGLGAQGWVLGRMGTARSSYEMHPYPEP